MTQNTRRVEVRYQAGDMLAVNDACLVFQTNGAVMVDQRANRAAKSEVATVCDMAEAAVRMQHEAGDVILVNGAYMVFRQAGILMVDHRVPFVSNELYVTRDEADISAPRTLQFIIQETYAGREVSRPWWNDFIPSCLAGIEAETTDQEQLKVTGSIRSRLDAGAWVEALALARDLVKLDDVAMGRVIAVQKPRLLSHWEGEPAPTSPALKPGLPEYMRLYPR